MRRYAKAKALMAPDSDNDNDSLRAAGLSQSLIDLVMDNTALALPLKRRGDD